MVQKQHVNTGVVAKVSPTMKLLVSSTVSLTYFERSWRCLTFIKKVSTEGHMLLSCMCAGVYPNKLLTSHGTLKSFWEG